MSKNPASLPLVYSCSGCSSAAQLANAVAIALDREGRAEMSCIAGVGAGVVPLVRTARSGRPILVLDGCPLGCAKGCLANQGVTPTAYLELHALGVAKVKHADYLPADFERIRALARAAAATCGAPMDGV